MALLVILFAVAPMVCFADDSTGTRSSQYWADLGLGFESVGFAADFSFSYECEQHLLTARITGSTEIPVTLTSAPRDLVEDIAILYGRTLRGHGLEWSFSAGPSYVRGVGKGVRITTTVYEERRYSTVGLALDARFSRSITPFLGLSLGIFANVNPEHSVMGGVLSVRLGRLLL